MWQADEVDDRPWLHHQVDTNVVKAIQELSARIKFWKENKGKIKWKTKKVLLKIIQLWVIVLI